jgi:hypothetical protein
VGKFSVELLVTRYPLFYAAPHARGLAVGSRPLASGELWRGCVLCASLRLSQPLGKSPPLAVGILKFLVRVPNGGASVLQHVRPLQGSSGAVVEPPKVLVLRRIALGDRSLVDAPPNVLGVALNGLDMLALLTKGVSLRIELEGVRLAGVGSSL